MCPTYHFFFFNDTATTEIYTLSLHDALPIWIHPFSGEIKDGEVWGRGAVDMKDMDAMILAVVRQRLREGRRPPRDLVLTFLADEEAGGVWGGGPPVDKPRDLFGGANEAIGEAHGCGDA